MEKAGLRQMARKPLFLYVTIHHVITLNTHSESTLMTGIFKGRQRYVDGVVEIVT